MTTSTIADKLNEKSTHFVELDFSTPGFVTLKHPLTERPITLPVDAARDLANRLRWGTSALMDDATITTSATSPAVQARDMLWVNTATHGALTATQRIQTQRTETV